MKKLILIFLFFGIAMFYIGCSDTNPSAPALSQDDQVMTTLAKAKTTFTGQCTHLEDGNSGTQMPLPNGKVLSEGETAYWYDSANEPLVSGVSKWYINRIINVDGSQKIWGKAEIFVGTNSETEDPETNNNGIWEITWHGWLTTTTPELVCDAAGTGMSGDVKGMVANWVYTFNFGLYQYDTEGYILK